ncbi:RNA polymerase sigma factor [Acidobacteriota bacterium]
MESSHGEVYALIARIREGDQEAFMTLTRLYQKKIFLVAYSFFRNKEDAMDIVQDTFMKLYQKIHMYNESRNFQNWLIQIAKNLCIDLYRRQTRKETPINREKDIGEMNLADEVIMDTYKASDIRGILKDCLDKLSEKQRLIFVMKHYNNMKYSEIAEILNIALGTVKSLHFKAVQNLKSLMTPYMGRTA